MHTVPTARQQQSSLVATASQSPTAWLVWRAVVMALLLALAPGCGDETALDPTAPPDEPVGGSSPGSCQPGEIEGDDGSCQPAGLPPDLPPAGPPEPPEAGVPPDQCAAGFESDGEGGCVPILPAEACPAGLMAVPGETECREVAPCGQGTWGEIPVEPDTQYVDQSFVGASDGSSSSPWTSIQEGVDAAAPGAIVAVAEGSYLERVDWMGKAVRLWGRCPALVEIVGVGPQDAVLVDDADGSEVRALAVTGPAQGVMVQLSAAVVVDQVWVHHTGTLGVTFLDCPAGVLTNSLVEAATGVGVEVLGSEVTIDRVAVRDTQVATGGDFGRGVEVTYDGASDRPATAVLSGSVVERNHEVGVVALSADVDIMATAIRDTAPSGAADPLGYGLVYVSPHDPRAAGVVTGAVIDGAQEACVSLWGSDLAIDNTTVRRCAPTASGWRGYGIAIYEGLGDSPEFRSVAAISASLVADTHGTGVLAMSSDVTLDRVLVRDVQVMPATAAEGYGVNVGTSTSALGRGSVRIESCLIEASHHAGVAVYGADVAIESSIVRDTLPPDDGTPAAGLFLVPDHEIGQRTVATVRTSLIEGSYGMGILVEDVEATVISSIIQDTQPAAADQNYGFGVFVNHMTEGLRGSAILDGSIISHSHSQGVMVVGSDVALHGTVVRDTQIGQGPTSFGRGLELQPYDDAHRSTGTIRSSVFEGHHDAGVFVWSSDLVFEGSIIQDTLPGAEGAGNGYGIVATGGPDGAQRSSAVVRGSILQRNSVAGVVVSASDMTLESTLVTDIAPQASSQRLGRCLGAQDGATVTVRHCRLQRCHEGGLLLIDSDARVVDSVVQEIWPRASDELFGDGIALTQVERGCSVDLLRTRVESTSRAGLVSFGGSATVTNSSFECNPIDLDAETYLDTPALFTDGGGNDCGCDDVPVDCAVRSANLAPPDVLPE